MNQESPAASATPKPAAANGLTNVLVNIIVPVLVLSFCSKDPALVRAAGGNPHAWNLGPHVALILALLFPIGYGVWHFFTIGKPNLFSLIGLFSVLLTGGLTLYLWSPDGTVKDHANWWFAAKEASIPLIFALTIFLSGKSDRPLLFEFVYQDSLFNIPKITRFVEKHDRATQYRSFLRAINTLFSLSFVLSAAINLGLSLYLFRGFDNHAKDAQEIYNKTVASITGWGFVVVLVPVIICFYFLVRRLIGGLIDLTGLPEDDIMMPR